METRKRWSINGKRLVSLLPTICFLLLALFILYGAIRLAVSLFSVPSEAGKLAATPTASIGSSTPTQAAEPVSEAIAVLTPAPTASAAPALSPSPSAAAALSSSLPTATPFAKAKTSFTDSRIDLLVIGRKEDGTPACVAAIAMRNSACTVLFLPSNTVSEAFGPLNRTKTVPRTLQAIESILPVSYGRYVSVDISGVPDCIDALGGILVGEETLYGRDVAPMLADNGSDELIRINTQQKLIDAFLVRLKSAGLLRFAALKSALQGCTGGNLTNAQYLKLYQAFRHIKPQEIDYRILPVDSAIKDGARCYIADNALVARLVAELYG